MSNRVTRAGRSCYPIVIRDLLDARPGRPWYVQNVTFRMLRSECYVQNVTFRMLRSECYVQNVTFRMLRSECYVLNDAYTLLDARPGRPCYVQNVRYRMLRAHIAACTMLRMHGYFDVEIRIRRYSICP